MQKGAEHGPVVGPGVNGDVRSLPSLVLLGEQLREKAAPKLPSRGEPAKGENKIWLGEDLDSAAVQSQRNTNYSPPSSSELYDVPDPPLDGLFKEL